MHLSKASLALALGLLVASGQAVVSPASPSCRRKGPAPGLAAANLNCRNTGDFGVWLDGFRKEAISQGISRATVAAALDGIALDPGVIARDRKQGFFPRASCRSPTS